jgi:hypothetical protein
LSAVIHAVLRTSLSCDPQVNAFASRESAVKKMRGTLIGAGWPESEATKAAEKGSEVLVADDGDSDGIRIVTLTVQP